MTADSGTWKKTWKCCLLGKLDRTSLIYRLVLDFWKHLSSLRPQVPLTWKSIRCFGESSQLFCNMQILLQQTLKNCCSCLPSPNPILTFCWISSHRITGGHAFSFTMGHQRKICSSSFKIWKENIWNTKVPAQAWRFREKSMLVIYRLELYHFFAFGCFCMHCSQRQNIPTELPVSCAEFYCCFLWGLPLSLFRQPI